MYHFVRSPLHTCALLHIRDNGYVLFLPCSLARWSFGSTHIRDVGLTKEGGVPLHSNMVTVRRRDSEID